MCLGKSLRLIAIHGAKITKNQSPWYILLDYFTTGPSFKNVNIAFLTKWTFHKVTAEQQIFACRKFSRISRFSQDSRKCPAR